jgi:ParB family chromosome partitioning protein
VLQDGHRRHAAVLRAIEKGAPIKTVPVVLKERSDNAVDLTLALLHSNEGEPFSTYEKAVLAKRLKKMGWENKQIAEEFRCTAAFVGQLLTMAGAPQAIAELVQNGNLSATEAPPDDGARCRGSHPHGDRRHGPKAGRRSRKITAKDLSPADLKAKNAKKYGYEMYRCSRSLRDDPAIEKKIERQADRGRSTR